MAEVTFYFNSRSTGNWTDPDHMIDNILTNYATIDIDGTIETLNGNSCPGTDLGEITKVEIRGYGYGDSDDKLGFIPVFTGGDGNLHSAVPGVSPIWTTYHDITNDANAPSPWRTQEVISEQLVGDSSGSIFSSYWSGQTFTMGGTAKTLARIELLGKKVGSPGDVTISIRAIDGEGKPTGEDLTYGVIAEADIPTSDDWFGVNVTPYELQANTQYAIVFRAPDGDTDNKLQLSLSAGGDVFAGGCYAYSSGSGGVWVLYTDEDFKFKLFSSSYSWINVQNLDCKVIFTKSAKANTMHCAKVEMRVTYAPPAAVIGPFPTHFVIR